MIFYKENKLANKFDVPEGKLKKLYSEWLESKDPAWVNAYHAQLTVAFVTSQDGLNAVPDEVTMYDELEQMFKNITDKYLLKHFA